MEKGFTELLSPCEFFFPILKPKVARQKLKFFFYMEFPVNGIPILAIFCQRGERLNILMLQESNLGKLMFHCGAVPVRCLAFWVSSQLFSRR